ncbi:MAG: DEAD/DEAH box helicase [Muribaculaceae bacterium]|nr:DEAD/DEAH box helicase [Muribaculaceae bacterium]
MTFDEILTNDDLLDALYDMHFNECTPIQAMAIPPALEGRDILAVAQTGTGKTAAYLLPVIEQLINDNYPQDNVNCVVMAPTRELAQQIDHQMQGFSYYMPVTSMAIYGGTDGVTYEQQRKGLKSGADVVIATPGRLLSHINMGYVDLSKVSFFILDEADRMLDMGFYDDIMKIAAHLPKERQTMLFSATMPDKIEKLAAGLLDNPFEIKLSMSKPAEKIKQVAYVCHEEQKVPLLQSLFRKDNPERVVIFASSKQKVKELTSMLRRLKLNVAEMHSDLEQKERDEVMLKFKASRINVIVATDILSRGIDIDNIETVINFDVPREEEDYVHRIGRTARADKEGRAITFINSKDMLRFNKIEKFLENEVEKLPLPEGFSQGPEYKILSVKGKRKWRGRSKNHSGKNSSTGKNSNTSSEKTSINRRRRRKKTSSGGGSV